MPRGAKKMFPSVRAKMLEWVHVNKNDEVAIELLRKQFKFSVLDLQDVPPPVQRPKVVARDGYVFMILLYPHYDKQSRDVRTTEVDFFISENRLVTVNADGYEPLAHLFQH